MLTNYGENFALDRIFGSGTPATIYIGITTSDPGETGDLAGEPTIGTNGYARITVTNNSTNWPAASGGDKSNAGVLAFPASTGAWASGGDFTHYFLSDAATAGNMIVRAALNSPLRSVPGSGSTLTLPIGAIVIRAA